MRDSPRDRYAQHKSSAKQRGVEFDMTFDEWWQIWQSRFEQRGRQAGKMQMCRAGDVGAYRSGNVRIASIEENRAEQRITGVVKEIVRDWVIDGEDRSQLRDAVVDRYEYGRDYFRERVLREKALEAGAIVDEDESS